MPAGAGAGGAAVFAMVGPNTDFESGVPAGEASADFGVAWLAAGEVALAESLSEGFGRKIQTAAIRRTTASDRIHVRRELRPPDLGGGAGCAGLFFVACVAIQRLPKKFGGIEHNENNPQLLRLRAKMFVYDTRLNNR